MMIENRHEWTRLHHLAYIYAAIASVDGSVGNDELAVLCERLGRWEPQIDERTLMSIVMAAIAALGSDVDAQEMAQLEASLQTIGRDLDPVRRGALLDDLIGIAGADGTFAPAEGDVLLLVRNTLQPEEGATSRRPREDEESGTDE